MSDPLGNLFEQFVRERIYLHNVTPKTQVWYWTGWKAFCSSQVASSDASLIAACPHGWPHHVAEASMFQIIRPLLVALALVAVGWLIGRAQIGVPQFFSLTIDAPVGSTTIRCNGCELFSWAEGRSTAQRQFTLTCSGPQCCSQTIGGTPTGPLQIASSRPESR
jgi:hypothetical protein